MHLFGANRLLKVLVVLWAVWLGLVSGSGAQERAETANPGAAPAGSAWKLTVSPYAWAASLNGRAGMARESGRFRAPFSRIFDHLDFTFMGNLELSNGRYGGYLDGQYTDTSARQELGNHDLSFGLRTTMLTGGLFYRAWEHALPGDTVFGAGRVVALEPTLGLRWTRLKIDARAGSDGVARSEQWTDPFVGARLLADLSARWNLFVQADVGGFGAGTRLSANGQAYLGYRALVLNRPVLFRVGYRALYQDYRKSSATSFRWDVWQHGPVLGVSMEF